MNFAARFAAVVVIVFTSISPLVSLSLAAEENKTSSTHFQAGAAKVDVTPQKLPIRIAGSISERYADTITDPLHVRALVMQQGETKLAIAVVDSCLVARETLDAAKKKAFEITGIPVNRMLISATHTHSAPVVMGVHGNDPEIEYRDFLQEKISDAIVRAYENREPAQAGWGSADCHDYVYCRRWEMKPGTAFTIPFTGRTENRAQMNPGATNTNKMGQVGPVDPAVTVLILRRKNGTPLGLLANYSTHYAGAPEVSADYFGVFADRMEEALKAHGQSFVAIMSNGTSGDANCIDFSNPDQEFDRFTVAEATGQAALKAVDNIRFQDNPTLAMKESKLTLKVRMPSPKEVSEARAWLSENLKDRPVRTWEENYARETVLLSEMPSTRELKLQVLQIGDLAITAIPCEVYGSTGLKLKQLSPFPLTMNISLANGCDGYLPPPEQFALGGYTTWRARSSCLEIAAEPTITQALEMLLYQLHAPQP